MEDERDRAEFKHVCKLCNKRYPSGKSLGGHMRSHVIANAQKAKALLMKNKAATFEADFDRHDHHHDVDHDEDDSDGVAEKNGSGHSGYGLRENPKKSWRASSHHHHHHHPSNFKTHHQNHHQNHNHNQNQNQQDQRVCKQCGKAFQSLKALCGHMSSHSERERNFKDEDEEDDHSWSSESHSDHHHHHHHHTIINNNNLESKRQTRSSYSRYKSLTVVDSLSNNSEIDQHEQEEVAICLMMLSRDYSSTSGYKPTPNFTAESSDNNSVILSSSKNKFDQQGKLNNAAPEMDNSDSGYFENGAKELDSDDSVGGYFVKNYYYYSGSKKPDYGSGSSDGPGSRKRPGFDSPGSEENSSKKMKQDHCHDSSNNNQKGQKFKTNQALGTHIITHSNNSAPKMASNNNYAKNKGVVPSAATSAAANSAGVSKKMKGHKCPYCPKVFKSGQALGGHKRAHMMGSGGPPALLPASSSRVPRRGPGPGTEPEAEPKPGPPPALIDLNLPAPVEEEASGGNSQFVTW